MSDDTFDPSEVIKTLKSEDTDSDTKTSLPVIEDVEPRKDLFSKVISSTTVPPVTSKPKKVMSTKTTQPVQTIKPTLRPRLSTTSSERAYDIIVNQLERYRLAKYGSSDKVQALEKIIDTIMKYPKKIILDTILEFFVEHKDEEFLDEYHALQGIVACEPAVSMKIGIFYSVMMGLAKGTASKKTISMEMIKNVFQKEDFNVWLTMQLRNR